MNTIDVFLDGQKVGIIWHEDGSPYHGLCLLDEWESRANWDPGVYSTEEAASTAIRMTARSLQQGVATPRRLLPGKLLLPRQPDRG